MSRFSTSMPSPAEAMKNSSTGAEEAVLPHGPMRPCLPNDAAIATTVGYLLRRMFRRNRRDARPTQNRGTATGAVRRWFKGLVLIGSGTLFLPIAASGGRPAIMRSLVLAARGSGRIAAEICIVYEDTVKACVRRSTIETPAGCPDEFEHGLALHRASEPQQGVAASQPLAHGDVYVRRRTGLRLRGRRACSRTIRCVGNLGYRRPRLWRGAA